MNKKSIAGKIIAGNLPIKDAMKKVCDGEITVPRFQRDFVWNAKKIASLMQSIGNGFPLGVILLAETKGSPLSGRNDIFQFLSNGSFKEDGRIVIDGQQRLTSISIVYHATEIVEHFKKSKRVSGTISDVVRNVCSNLCFYKNSFYEKESLVEILVEEGIEEFHANTQVGKYVISLQTINDQVKEYLKDKNLFTHTLYEWSDSEIINIFTSMNQATKPLTHVDLMNGSMFNASDESFDLLDRIKEFNKILGNWGKFKQELYVQCLKIFFDLKVSVETPKSINYKPDVLVKWAGLESYVNPTIKRIDEFEDILKNTISVLDTKLDIYSFEMLPKEVYLLAIFSLLCLVAIREKDFDDILKKLVSRITIRLISGDYASSPNAKAQDDINLFLLPLCGFGQKNDQNYNFELIKQDLNRKLLDLTYKQKNQALFKLFLSTLAAQVPRNLFEKGFVPLKPTVVTKMDKNIHHWIPENSKTNKDFHFAKINSIGNLTLIKEDENKNEIRAKDLKTYLGTAKEIHGAEFGVVISSHLFNLESLNEFMRAIENGSSPVVVHQLFESIVFNRVESITQKIFDKFIG